jgi:outer membrane protein assembly factor BamB
MGRLLSLLLLLPFLSPAQTGYTFNRLGTDFGLGLASNTIFSTYQDKKGFIWIGTSNGLQRFDGNKFVKFGSKNPAHKHLLWAEVGQILPAKDNRIWLYFPMLDETGLYNIATGEYEPVPFEPKRKAYSQNAKRLWQDSRGNTFLLLPDQEILHYYERQKKFVQDDYFPLPAGWRPGLNLFEDTVKGHIWIPCVDSGFAVLNTTTRDLHTRSRNPLPLLTKKELLTDLLEIFIDKQRRHWVFYWTDRQHRRCFDENGKELSDTAGLGGQQRYPKVHQFFQSRSSSLWIFGNNLLYSYDGRAKKFFSYEPGLSPTGIQYQQVHHLMEDRDGNLWLSTDNGLFYTASASGNASVVNLLFDEAKGDIEITDILQLQSGGYWLSTWGEGLIALDKEFNRTAVSLFRNLPRAETPFLKAYQQAWGLYQHDDGKIWIGCQEGRYMIHDPATAQTSFHTLKDAEGAPIRYITRGSNGDLFFATHRRGHVIRYDGKNFTKLHTFETTIPKLFVDNRGLIWVVTLNQGLYCLSADGSKILQRYTTANGLYSNTGYDIDQLNDSTLVFAAGTLHFINTISGAVTQKTFDDGLPGNSVRRIRKDATGNLWLITLNGLCRYSPKTAHFTHYERKDGITLASVARNADLLTREGLILFGGANAFFSFHPGQFESNQPPPDVTITDIRLFNDFLPLDSLMELKRASFEPGQNTFRFYFSSLSYAQKGQLTYYYKMDGVHKDWIKADRLDAVDFTLLPPGDYTFSIYAANLEGLRSARVTLFRFTVQPYFWQTWWFIGLMAILVALLLYYFYRQRINKLLAVEAVRSRVARDLHDDVGSTLSTINILGSMAKTKLQVDTVKTGEYISKITENSQRMMEAMDDIVWSIKPDNDTVQKMMVRMKEFALGVLEAKDIAVWMKVEENVGDVKLNMEARRDLFLIFKEAINNVAKYSKANNVSIHLACHNKRLVLTVKDDGIGFNPQTADGNGLGNMEKRTVSLKGRFQLQTKPGGGTSITANIPVA